MLLQPLNEVALSTVAPDLKREIATARTDRNHMSAWLCGLGVAWVMNGAVLMDILANPTFLNACFAGIFIMLFGVTLLVGSVCWLSILLLRLALLTCVWDERLRRLGLASQTINKRGSALSRAVEEWNRRASELEADVDAMEVGASHEERNEQFKRASLLLETRGVIEQEAELFHSLAPRIADQATST